MKKLLILIILTIAAVVTLAVVNKDKFGDTAAAENAGAVQISMTPLSESEQNAELTQEYVHPEYNFAFKYPEGYTVNSTVAEGAEMLIMQNSKGQGFQMSITPIEEDVTEVTIDMVKRDLPDLEVREPQDLLVGANGKGVAFLSNDPIFEGNSREIWFVHNKVFYQISTYAKFDTLMKNIFATWEFR